MPGLRGLKSGYYAAKNRLPGPRAVENELIVEKIREAYMDPRMKAYGSPRMTVKLNEEYGLACSENRVARLMAANNLRARSENS